MAKVPRKTKFEDAMKRLDTIVEAMESGQTGIEETVEAYAEAMELAAHCRGILEATEQRIQQIQTSARGEARAVPFEPGDEDSGGDESGD